MDRSGGTGCYGIIGAITFVAAWWWMITHFWFWGFALGWIPAMIAAAFWPIVLVLAVFGCFS